MSNLIPASQTFVPVITGGDLGAYSLAREFHEAYGVQSAIVPTADNLVVGGSKITQLFPAGQMFDPARVVRHLGDVANMLQQEGPRPLILLAGYDHLVRIMVDHDAELRDMGYVFPTLTVEQLDQASLKENFYALCEKLGIHYPRTAIYDCAGTNQPIEEFVNELVAPDWHYPLIVKAGDGGAWANTRFEGRRKVHYVETSDELGDVLRKAIDAGYEGTLIIQQFIPGPDSNLRILTHFRDRHGNLALTGLAQVIVEDHASGLEGNSRALIAAADPKVEAQGAELLDALEWHGFGMFDIKIHQHTGEPYFLEMNPRLGRHHYYLTVAGANPSPYLVRELVEAAEHPPAKVTDGPAASMTIPMKLAYQYASEDQAAQLRAAKRAKRVGWPLRYGQDRNVKRDLYQRLRLTKAAREIDHVPGTMNT
ncbi:carboxylate--amine ligase [Yaniella halotolerans]|uniref:carboxylate--amine ligase n=1 Tax=Yaniella halotolerans TaxID=225453 RepID=UPI0003B6AED8|nr:hypothetical protein [Yaniella halotolerans]